MRSSVEGVLSVGDYGDDLSESPSLRRSSSHATVTCNLRDALGNVLYDVLFRFRCSEAVVAGGRKAGRERWWGAACLRRKGWDTEGKRISEGSGLVRC